MRRLLILTVVIACGAGLYVRATQSRPARGFTIEHLIDIRHPSNPMWAPDGRHVAFVWDRAGVAGVYLADAAAPSAAPRELKDAGSQLAGAFWSANGQALMIPKDGDLWRVPIDGGAASAVWTTPANESSIVASPEGGRVAFVRAATAPAADIGGSNRLNDRRGGGGSTTELWVRTLSDGREVLVARRDGAITGVGWSPDGQS